MSIKEKAQKYIGWGVTALCVLCGGILFYFILVQFPVFARVFGKILKVLSPIIIGMVIAYLIAPGVNALERLIFRNGEPKKQKTKKRVRLLCVAFCEILFLLLISGCLRLIIPQLATSIGNIVDNYDKYYDNFTDWLTSLEKKYPDASKQIEIFINDYSDKFNDYFNTTLVPIFNGWIKTLTSGLFSFVKALFNFIIGYIISFYLLFSKERFVAQGKKIIYAVMKKDKANAFIHNIRFADKTFNGFIVGKIVDSIIIGILCYILSVIIQLPYPILISVIIGVTNVIPFFGPFIGAIPCAILVLLISPIQCLYFLIMILLLQQFDGNILGPKILGNTTGITGFWVIFAITFFGGLWGPVGMIIGVPLFAVIYTMISAALKTKLESKGLTSDTGKYKNINYIDEEDEFKNIPKDKVKTITTARSISEDVKETEEAVEEKKKLFGIFKKKPKGDSKSE